MARCRQETGRRLYGQVASFLCLKDLRRMLREGASDEAIVSAITTVWQRRDDRYSELRTAETEAIGSTVRKVEMSYIGG